MATSGGGRAVAPVGGGCLPANVGLLLQLLFDGAAIVEGGGVSSIEPGSTDIFEITLRNEGNSWRNLELESV